MEDNRLATGGERMLAEVAATQAALLAGGLLTTRHGYRAANRLLAALMLTIGVMIALATVLRSPSVVWLPHLIRVNHPIDFLPGPLLYLYVRVLLGNGSVRRSDWVHFLPALLCALYLLPYYLQSGAAKLSDLSSSSYATWYLVRSALAILVVSAYVALAIGHVVRWVRRQRIAGEPAVPRIAAPLKFLCAGFVAVVAIAAVRLVVDASLPVAMPMTSSWLPAVGTVILCGMVYCGLRDSAELVTQPAPARSRKYGTSSLTWDRAERGRQALLRALESDRVYLDPELTLKSLANRLGMSASHLSQIINERLGQNFADLINRYRIEEAKRRLLDPALRHYSIVAIAEETGFRSKSSFNAVFKRHAQMTPSAFRQHRPEG
jgi:AraC-like DNA-binding protein